MALDGALMERLLTSIENNKLVFLCGAGLSIPAPSNLPTAKCIAQTCYDRRRAIEALPTALRDDIDAIATYFYAKGQFKNAFIPLVPWNELLGQPNKAHAAVADLLITRGARAALSTNFDALVETWAQQHKVDMRAALNGQEAMDFTESHNPLLKFHGCMHKCRSDTLWTHAQLADVETAARVESCSNWMTLNLPGKDIVVVGFWSDWGYLNDVLATAFAIHTANSVTVIDPSTPDELQQKAPQLWDKLHELSDSFEHVQSSGAEALEQLREAHSKVWVRKFYFLAEPFLAAVGAAAAPVPGPVALTGSDLYALRQDSEGVPYTRAARLKSPDAGAGQAAFIRVLLLNAGAVQRGAWLEHAGRTIRVVNGAGRALGEMKDSYSEPTTVVQPELVICAGAADLGVPGRIIPAGTGASAVRPAPGGTGRWLTLDQARAELAI